MDALDLTTGERISAVKYLAKGNRRKASAPQRRHLADGPANEPDDTRDDDTTPFMVDSSENLDEDHRESNPSRTGTPEVANMAKTYIDQATPNSASLSRETSPRSSVDDAPRQPYPGAELKQIDLTSLAQNRGRPFQFNINNNSNGMMTDSASNASDERPKKSGFETRSINGDFAHGMLPGFSGSTTVDDLMQQRLRRYLDDVQPAEAPGIPERTKKQNRWAFNVWREWARKRNMLEDSFAGVHKGVPLDVGQANEEELDYWLCKFVMEIRRKDGHPYPPHTLMQIVMGIQRYLRQQAGKPSICILDRSNPTYRSFRSVLDYRIKELASNGAASMKNVPKASLFRDNGTKLNKYMNDELPNFPAELPVTKKDSWDRGLIGTESAQALLNAVFYHNHKTFDIQYIDDHWNLRAENFAIHVDSEADGQKFLEFTPSPTSMMVASGKANGVQVTPKRIDADPNNNECVFNIYEKYLSLIPNHGPFYRHPVDPTIVDRSIKFSDQWVGKNRLRAMLKNLIDTGTGYTRQRIHYPSERAQSNAAVLNNYAASLIQLPRLSDGRSSQIHDKLGVIKPVPAIKASDILSGKLSDRPSYQEDESVESSPKRLRLDHPPSKLDGSKVENPRVTFDSDVTNQDDDFTANDSLHLTVPTTIKSVTILKGSRKITLQLD